MNTTFVITHAPEYLYSTRMFILLGWAISEIYVTIYVSLRVIIMIIDIITISIRLTVTMLLYVQAYKKFIEVAKIRCHEQ